MPFINGTLRNDRTSGAPDLAACLCVAKLLFSKFCFSTPFVCTLIFSSPDPNVT